MYWCVLCSVSEKNYPTCKLASNIVETSEMMWEWEREREGETSTELVSCIVLHDVRIQVTNARVQTNVSDHKYKSYIFKTFNKRSTNGKLNKIVTWNVLFLFWIKGSDIF